MPDCPPALRGQLYSTHLTQRCPEYHPCRRCLMCAKFDRHSLMCQSCEGAKPGRKHECHPDKVAAIVQLEEKLGRPLFDINADAKAASSTPIVSSADEGGVGAALAQQIVEEG